MALLTVGDLAKLSGYSRVRMHQFATEGRIPAAPLKKPPAGHYRFNDSPEIREWCKKLKRDKPKPGPRKTQVRGPSMRIRAAYGKMCESVKSGGAREDDIQCALDLLRPCTMLANFPFENPVTKGALAVLAAYLLRSNHLILDRWPDSLNAIADTFKKLEAALKKINRSKAK